MGRAGRRPFDPFRGGLLDPVKPRAVPRWMTAVVSAQPCDDQTRPWRDLGWDLGQDLGWSVEALS
ncbi:MAG: hypothetical protein ACPGFC_01900 [Paracoccaceae bacterium]